MGNNNIKSLTSRKAISRLTTHLRTGARVSSPSSGVRPGARALNLELPTSFGISLLVGVLGLLFGGLLFSHSAYAASYLNVSSGGAVSLGSIRPTSSGTSSTGSDTLTVHTDCSAGYSVYVSGQNGKDTNLTNSSAESNNTISASSNAIGSAGSLSSNTWGLNSENTGTYVGLPTYANATNKALTTKTSVSETSTVPIYYGIKVDTSITPGTYTGDVLYTVLMDSSCLAYTVIFNSNGGSGTMANQSIMASTATALTANAFTRSGYAFLGWSTNSSATTATYADGESVTDLTTGGSSITLYAVWQKVDGTMQGFSCASLASGATANLQDTRDGQVYSVYRIPVDQTYAGIGSSTIANIAGKCLMTKDLSLGYVTGGSITKGADLVLDATASAASGTITARTGTSDWNTEDTDTNLQYTNGPRSGYEAYSNHSYYSYGAAQKVCPKGWRLPTGAEYASNTSSSTAPTAGLSAIVGNSADGSSALQTAPWSFVLGGSFFSSGWSNQGSLGSYWSSTQSSSTDGYSLNFNAPHVYRSGSGKNNGRSVRCIADVATMQDFDAASSLPNTGDSTYLVDARDNKTYAVKRLPDGKVWMVQNLALGMSATEKGLTLTPSDTNIDNGTTYYLPPAGKQGSSTIDQSSTLTATDAANFTNNSSTDQHAKTQFRAKGSGYSTSNKGYANDSDTGYYNFYTATLGFSYYSDYKTPSSSTRDICPKGWRLPWTTNSGATRQGSAEFYMLALAYNSDSSAWTDYIAPTGTSSSSPYSSNTDVWAGMLTGIAANGNNFAGFSYVGAWFGTSSSANPGSAGQYWSSSVYHATDGYFLDLSSSYTRPQIYNDKAYGLAVRCIAQSSYTVNYSSTGADSGTPSKTSETITDGANLTFPTAGTMVKSGFEFKGWALKSDATEVAYTADSSIRVSALATAAKSAGQTVTSGGTITLYPVFTVPDDGNLGNMQDSTCYSITPGHTATLTDTRDGQEYSIYRWPDTGTAGTDYPTGMAGYCIMTKDLSLGYVTGGFVTAGSNLTLTTSDSAAAATITARAGTGDWSSTNSDDNKQYINGPQSGKEEHSSHSYYSFGAALAVCPKGWLPFTSDQRDDIITFMGGDSQASSKNIRGVPYNFAYGGYFYSPGWDSVGSEGGYWSSTQNANANGRYLRFNSSYLYAFNGGKNFGRSVRCVAEPVEPVAEECSATVHPTTTTGCKMKDGNTWKYGNDGNTTTWASSYTCPSGYSSPTKDIFDSLVSAQGSGSQLYSVLGLSSTRSFWSSTKLNSYGYALTVTGSSATVGIYGSYSYYVLCYKPS